MPRTKTPQATTPTVSQLSVRLTEDERLRLSAVAYELALAGNLAETTSDVNLSRFIRRVLDEFINSYISEHPGGEEAILKRYHDSKVREVESQLKELRRQ